MLRTIFTLSLVILSTGLFAKNYCISKDGNSNPGMEEYSFDRLNEVFEMLQPGDTLFFRQGEYMLASTIQPVKSGTKDQPIVITHYPRERAIFNGINFKNSENSDRPIWRSRTGIITITGVSHVKLIGLEVMNSRNIGIVVKDTTTTFIELIDCKSHGSYNSGIGLWYARHVNVLHCEVTGANDQALRVTQPLRREGPHEAISVAGARYFEVAYNHVHSCQKEGIDCKEVSAHGIIHHNFVHDLPRQGIYADSWFGLLEDVEIYSNVVFGCEWGIAISSEGKNSSMRNIRIHHNLIFENRASGILFGVWGNNEHRENLQVYNNTVYHNGSPSHWAGKTGGIDVRSKDMSDVAIFNNICSENWAFEIATFSKTDDAPKVLKSKNIRIFNNLIESHPDVNEEPGEFNQVYSYDGEKTVYGNPLFKNPGVFNFSPSRKSPAWKGYSVPPGTKASKFIGALGKTNAFDPFL